MEIILIIGIILLGVAAALENHRAAKYKKQLADAIEAGLELQRNALANDAALRQGLDDQEEALSAEILDRDDTIMSLTEDRDAFRETCLRFATRLTELETAHAMHSDHCLPVLEQMREAAHGYAADS